MYLTNLLIQSGLETSKKVATISSFPVTFWKGTEKLLATIFLYSEHSAKIAPYHVLLDLMEKEEMNSSSSLKFTGFFIKNTNKSNKCLSREAEKGSSTSWILIVIGIREVTKLIKTKKAIPGKHRNANTQKRTHIWGTGEDCFL